MPVTNELDAIAIAFEHHPEIRVPENPVARLITREEYDIWLGEPSLGGSSADPIWLIVFESPKLYLSELIPWSDDPDPTVEVTSTPALVAGGFIAILASGSQTITVGALEAEGTHSYDYVVGMESMELEIAPRVMTVIPIASETPTP
jgi:hypothetical protein